MHLPPSIFGKDCLTFSSTLLNSQRAAVSFCFVFIRAMLRAVLYATEHDHNSRCTNIVFGAQCVFTTNDADGTSEFTKSLRRRAYLRLLLAGEKSDSVTQRRTILHIIYFTVFTCGAHARCATRKRAVEHFCSI